MSIINDQVNLISNCSTPAQHIRAAGSLFGIGAPDSTIRSTRTTLKQRRRTRRQGGPRSHTKAHARHRLDELCQVCMAHRRRGPTSPTSLLPSQLAPCSRGLTATGRKAVHTYQPLPGNLQQQARAHTYCDARHCPTQQAGAQSGRLPTDTAHRTALGCSHIGSRATWLVSTQL